MKYTHPQRVRILYKTILKLHRGLPQELNELGTKYVKDEFKRHKKCNIQEAETFIDEWTSYAVSLAKQFGLKGTKEMKEFVSDLPKLELDKFRDEQIYQFYELMLATKAPLK